MTPETEADPLLRVGEVARLLDLDVRIIRAEADAGELKAVRIGRRRDRRFQWSVVLAYCQRVGLALHIEKKPRHSR